MLGCFDDTTKKTEPKASGDDGAVDERKDDDMTLAEQEALQAKKMTGAPVKDAVKAAAPKWIEPGQAKSFTFEATKGLRKLFEPSVTAELGRIYKGKGVKTHGLGAQKAKIVNDDNLIYYPADSRGASYRETKNIMLRMLLGAWDQHRPIRLAPDHFWIMVMQGLAKHVNMNAEQLRERFVDFQGKKTLEVRDDTLVRGSMDNDWGKWVPEWTKQIDGFVKPDTRKSMYSNFSTTTREMYIASHVCVMDMAQSYFEYKMSTRCGFPKITLEGEKKDWVALRESVHNLIKTVLFRRATDKPVPKKKAEKPVDQSPWARPKKETKPSHEFGEWWLKALDSVLVKFIEPFDGKVDSTFWNSAVKRGARGGSGGRDWFSGWINVFYPYASGENRFCEPYSTDQAYVKSGLKHDESGGFRGTSYGTNGPDRSDFPTSVAKVPITWEYYGKIIPVSLHSGFLGIREDEDGTWSPMMGWIITDADAPAR